MMGREASESGKLFYSSINLEQRIRTDHILRKIKKHIDFDFVYKEVKEQYGSNGNVSVPPPVILKMMLLLIIYNVRSERELIDTLPERLDWLWFLGYDIDNEIPNHSVLSKARNRWGVEIFKHLFEKVVRQCVEAGLVAGKKLFMDSSLVQANAANNSVIWPEKLNKYLEKGYKILESRLEEKEGVEGKTNDTWKSETDPDASIVRRKGRKAKLEYQVHRGVDGKAEIITSSEVTPGKVNEAHKLKDLVEQHKMNTGIKAQTVIADKKYGTNDNYIYCYDNHIQGHMRSLKESHGREGRSKGIYSEEMFSYDKKRDVFICPGGEELPRRVYHADRKQYEYKAQKKACQECGLRSKCTNDKGGRTVKRHERQDTIDVMVNAAKSDQSLTDIKTRMHLMERSFARSVRYGYKRARWRRLWRVQIQEYITASIQNIMILIKNTEKGLGGVKKIMDISIKIIKKYFSRDINYEKIILG